MPIEAPETLVVTQTVVACDGGGGALGHPRVWLNMGDNGRVDCPYCDRLFLLENGPAHKAEQAEKSANETGGDGDGSGGAAA